MKYDGAKEQNYEETLGSDIMLKLNTKFIYSK